MIWDKWLLYLQPELLNVVLRITKVNTNKNVSPLCCIERNKTGRYWIHFAVRPKDNRRNLDFIRV